MGKHEPLFACYAGKITEYKQCTNLGFTQSSYLMLRLPETFRAKSNPIGFNIKMIRKTWRVEREGGLGRRDQSGVVGCSLSLFFDHPPLRPISGHFFVPSSHPPTDS